MRDRANRAAGRGEQTIIGLRPLLSCSTALMLYRAAIGRRRRPIGLRGFEPPTF